MEFSIVCPCACGAIVTARDAGFSATTVDVAACPEQRADGIVSVTIRKSASMALAAQARRDTAVRHTTGLVPFG